MKNLKTLRIEKKVSQEEMAKFLNMTQSNYGKYELEKTKPNIETMIKIADYLQTSIDYLVGRKISYMLDLTKIPISERQIIEKLNLLNETYLNCVNGYTDKLLENQTEEKGRIQQWRTKI